MSQDAENELSSNCGRPQLAVRPRLEGVYRHTGPQLRARAHTHTDRKFSEGGFVVPDA